MFGGQNISLAWDVFGGEQSEGAQALLHPLYLHPRHIAKTPVITNFLLEFAKITLCIIVQEKSSQTILEKYFPKM